MSDQHKIEILRILSEDAVTGQAVRYSFNTLSKNIGLTKNEIDGCLTELSKARFVAQYAKKGVDSFTVEIKPAGLDAVLDGSF
jgi:DNA-binding IclR family transcriptional regulator